MAEQCIMSFLVAAFVNVGGVINKQNKQNSVLLFCYNNNNKRHKKTIKAAWFIINVKAEAGIQLLKNVLLLMDHKLLPCSHITLYTVRWIYVDLDTTTTKFS